MDTNDWIQLKQFTGTRTLLEAKIELGQRLTRVYSAAYDPLGEVGVDMELRWRVLHGPPNTYRVFHWQDRLNLGNLTKDKHLKKKAWEHWTAMTVDQALKYVKNPALLMVLSGLLESYGSRPFSDRIMLLYWINPTYVDKLCKAAIAERSATSTRDLEADKYLQKKVWTKNGMKQIIHTGHVSFDKQTSMIATGNNWGNTIHGSYIRPFTETYNGASVYRKPGYLQTFDLQFYVDIGTPKNVLDTVRQEAREKQVILYALFHHYTHRGRPNRVVHGYILTTEDYRLIQSWNTGPSYKSHFVIEGCLPYLAWVGDVD